MTQSIGYQGNPGSFSEQALLDYINEISYDAVAVPYPTIDTLVEAFKAREIDGIFPAIGNNNRGCYRETLFALTSLNFNCWIAGEHYLAIEEHFLVLPDVAKNHQTIASACRNAIKQVLSQDLALNQCLRNIQTYRLIPVPTEDTALAAKTISEKKLSETAAIASLQAGKIYGLTSLGNFADNPNNFTRFWHVAHQTQERLEQVGKSNTSDSDNLVSLTNVIIINVNPHLGLQYSLGDMCRRGINIKSVEIIPDGTFNSQSALIEVEDFSYYHSQRIFENLRSMGHNQKIIGCFRSKPDPTVNLPHNKFG